MEDRFFDMQPPSIIVTAKGMPDMATRLFLRQLHQEFPHMVFAAGWRVPAIRLTALCMHACVHAPLYGVSA